ncbi:MAG: phosphate ABC transporter permease subunit PstC [Verrucomicrobiales bacterium]|nr:phosphate ABC transporter permease subunit PstC [Verrucomicrobiales bacterium]
MSTRSSQSPTRSAGWMGLRRGHRARPFEWVVERLILGVSFSALALLLLIVVFVGREALPILVGTADSSLIQPVIPAADMDRIPPGELRAYLGMTPAEFQSMDHDTLLEILKSREEGLAEVPPSFREDPDARINTTEWRHLLQPRRWTGYPAPTHVWQPIGTIHKYNIVPLIAGSLKLTLIGLLFAVPVSLAAALYLSQLAPARLREWAKPGIELLAGLPSVVIGVFALLVLASVMQRCFGYQYRLNALVAGVALGITAIPLVFTIAEDALTGVPRSYTAAALALGATRWQAAFQVVLPAALPGVLAAVVLGFGRCIGETMVVLMVSGNASLLSWSPFDSTRSITATIAAEMAEAVASGTHYQMLFLLGTLLFAVTFLTNLAGDLIIHRIRRQREGIA